MRRGIPLLLRTIHEDHAADPGVHAQRHPPRHSGHSRHGGASRRCAGRKHHLSAGHCAGRDLQPAARRRDGRPYCRRNGGHRCETGARPRARHRPGTALGTRRRDLRRRPAPDLMHGRRLHESHARQRYDHDTQTLRRTRHPHGWAQSGLGERRQAGADESLRETLPGTDRRNEAAVRHELLQFLRRRGGHGFEIPDDRTAARQPRIQGVRLLRLGFGQNALAFPPRGRSRRRRSPHGHRGRHRPRSRKRRIPACGTNGPGRISRRKIHRPCRRQHFIR